MKKIFTTLTFITFLTLIGCSTAPSIEMVEKKTAKEVEELLTEDNDMRESYRLDRYFLEEQVDNLTYKGTLKATQFYNTFYGPDSLKLYKTVIIKYQNKEYKRHIISIQSE